MTQQDTTRARRVFSAIVEYKLANDGCAPSTRDLMLSCDISSSSVVNRCLKDLERDGLIELAGVRSIRIHGGKWTYGKGLLP